MRGAGRWCGRCSYLMGYNRNMARPIRQRLAWALALWLMVAPVGMVLGCWYACNEEATSCCQSLPTADSLMAADSDECPNCRVCHPEGTPPSNLSKQPVPFIPLIASLTAEGAVLTLGEGKPLGYTEPAPIAYLFALPSQAPRAPPVMLSR
jgi:hypothetical protein